MKDLSNKLKRELQRKNISLERTKDHIDYYMERGMSKRTAIRYVKYWYKKR